MFLNVATSAIGGQPRPRHCRVRNRGRHRGQVRGCSSVRVSEQSCFTARMGAAPADGAGGARTRGQPQGGRQGGREGGQKDHVSAWGVNGSVA